MPADDEQSVNGTAAEWEALAARMARTVADIDAYQRRCIADGVRPEPGLLRSRDSLRRLLGDFGEEPDNPLPFPENSVS
jgi:hypothetical protein